MACLLKSTIKGLGLIQVCLIKKCYHLSVSRFISAWSWIINAFDWILLWSSWEKTQMTWASRTFPYILHFKQLVGVTDHRRHQNRNLRDKIGCTLCTAFLSLLIFYVFYDLLPVQYTELKFIGQPPKEYWQSEFSGNYVLVSLQIQVLYLQIHPWQIKTSISFVTFHHVMAAVKL